MLVTGAAGFIGSTLVDRLLADGHEVIGVDDLSRGRLENLEAAQQNSHFTWAEQDITTPGFVDLVAEHSPEVIHHLAAQIDVRVSVADPLLDARLNVLGTINVCEAAHRAGTRKVIHTSSGGSVYGSPAELPVSETAPFDPESPYAASKAAGEIYLGMYHHLHGLDWTVLALSNVYGPRQDPHGEAGVVAIFATAMLTGRRAKIFGDGTSTRDYVHVADVVDAFARAVKAGSARRYNIGTGIQTSVRHLHTLVADASGAPDDPEMAAPRAGELQAIALDCRRAADELSWTPRHAVAEGIAATVDWVRGQLTPA
jgi:UDP-glucose 4-epimerase